MSDGFDSGITRRQWLGRTAGVAAAAGMGSLLGGLPIGAARAQGQPKRGGTLRVASVDKPVNMDPGYAQLYSSLQIYQNVFNKLVYVDETGQFIPGLAKSWKQENDKSLALRPRRQCRLPQRRAVHREGRRLHLQPHPRRQEQAAHARLLHAGRGRGGGRIAPGALSPEQALGADARHARPGHRDGERKALQAKDPKLFPIGTGPYKFVEWVKDDHVTLERWDKYFRPSQPYIDRHHLQRARRRHRAPHRAADGEVQLDPDAAAAAHPRAGARARHEVLAGPAVLSVLLPAEREPAAPRRQAHPPGHRVGARPLGDREARLLRQPRRDRGADPRAEPVGHRRQRPQGRPDLARAEQLLSDAGVGSGLTLTYLVKSQVPVLVKTGEILREQLKKIGITLDVRPLESGQYFEELVGKKFDVAAAWWSVTVDPDLFYYPMQHSASPWNFCGFKSEEADRRLDAFRIDHESGGPEEDVPRPGPLAPGGRLAPHLQQRDPAVLDEAERAGLGAAVVPRAALRGHWLDRLTAAGCPAPPAGDWAYAARRLMLAVPLLLGMSVLVFGLMRLVPGDPRSPSSATRPPPRRSARCARPSTSTSPCRASTCLARRVVRGDFGLDFRQNEPIGRMILDRLPVTLELTLLAALAPR